MGELMQQYIDEAEQDLLHTYNRYQVVLDRGDGVSLYDIEGKRYLDFVAGIAVFALGYHNAEYNDALKAQIDKVIHTLPHGREQAHKVMQAVADHREEFEFTDHCSGPNMNATPQQIIERIERYSHVLLGAAFARPELQDVIKWHSKYARQNGIHVSPTFMVNGLVQPDLGSGDDVSVWAARIMA